MRNRETSYTGIRHEAQHRRGTYSSLSSTLEGTKEETSRWKDGGGDRDTAVPGGTAIAPGGATERVVALPIGAAGQGAVQTAKTRLGTGETLLIVYNYED